MPPKRHRAVRPMQKELASCLRVIMWLLIVAVGNLVLWGVVCGLYGLLRRFRLGTSGLWISSLAAYLCAIVSLYFVHRSMRPRSEVTAIRHMRTGISRARQFVPTPALRCTGRVSHNYSVGELAAAAEQIAADSSRQGSDLGIVADISHIRKHTSS